VDEVPPAGRLAVYGFQHVLAMYAGAVAVPLILAGAIGFPEDQLVYLINADHFTCGVATLIQTVGIWFLGLGLPLIQGVTFASVTPMILIWDVYGLQGIYGGVIVAGVLTFFVSPYFRRLLRFFPPVVTGSIITMIGISLLPVAVRWAGGGDPEAEGFGSPGNIALALAVLLLILAIYRFFSDFVSRIAILLGLILGTVIAMICGITDFSGVAEASWLGVTTPFYFGLPTFHLFPII
jgi:uric acid transporter